MKKRFLSVLILSSVFLTIQADSKAQTQWLSQGTVTLTEDVTIDNIKDAPPTQEGELIIDGQEHGVTSGKQEENGHGFQFYNEETQGKDEDDIYYDITVKNVGKYELKDEKSDGVQEITVLDESGNKTTKYLNVTNYGFKDFEFDSDNSTHDVTSAYTNTSVLYSQSKNFNVENSVFTNNKLIQHNSGANGGALRWEAPWIDEEEKATGVTIKNSVFINNSSKSTDPNDGKGQLHYETEVQGGALYLNGTGYDDNQSNKLLIENSYFLNNSVNGEKVSIMTGGGAVALGGFMDCIIQNTYFGGNSSEAIKSYGGALFLDNNYSYDETVDIINSVFEKNTSKGSYGGYGGALGAFHNTSIKNSLFLNNQVEGPTAKGGAAYFESRDDEYGMNQFFFEVDNTTFEGNTVKISNEEASPSDFDNDEFEQGNGKTYEYGDGKTDKASGGGAIYNENTARTTIKDSSFKNNKVVGKDAAGGAIFNAKDAKLVIIAENKDVIFEGNKAGESEDNLESSGIADNGGEISLNAKEGHAIHLNDKITSYQENDKGIININEYRNLKDEWIEEWGEEAQGTKEDYNGTVILNADMTGYKGKVNLAGGTLAVGENMPDKDGVVNLFTGAESFNVVNEARLDISYDQKIRNYNLGNLNLDGNLLTTIDADLAEGQMDKLSANSVSGEGKITVDAFNVLSDALDETPVELNLTDDTLKSHVGLGANANEAFSKIYKYGVTYDDQSGDVQFKMAGLIEEKPTPGGGQGGGSTQTTWKSFNPTVLASSVAVQAGAIATMNNTFYYAMQNADNYMKFSKAQRSALKSVNKYAATSASNGVFSPLYSKQSLNGFWFKPYATFEKVPLKDGPKVSNITYGALAGYDSEIQELKNGGERTFTAYVGYNGASQRFKGVDSYLNGGLLGFTLSHYKGNFFNATTVNAGDLIGDSNNMYGKEDFNLFMAGIASKTGYNWEIADGKVIFQPSMLIGYTFVNTFDYTNSAGVKINSDPTNVLQLSPGLRLILNTKNGWQPYIGANMIWNLINNSKVTANNVLLPEMSIKPYVQYGLGIQRQVENNFMLFGQAMAQNGGRNGVALTAGLRWAVGRN